MAINISHPWMETRASRGIVKDYNNPLPRQGITPPNDFKEMERMWRRDEVIATAMDTTIDMVTRNGWDFVAKSGDKKQVKTEVNKAIKMFGDLNFDEVIDNILYQMIIYGDSFLELRRTGGTVIDEIHPLETTEMRIQYDPHGKILGYTQIPRTSQFITSVPTDAPGEVQFTSDGVIHFRMKWMGSRIYSETPLEPVARIWAAKQNSFNYLDQMFMNLRPELFIHLRGAGKDQYEQAREILWRAKTGGQVSRPVLTYGAADSSIDIKESTANFGNTQGLFTVLEYLREAILMVTRVPPVWVGLVNRSGANKGNSEAQVFSFETRIKKIQQKTECLINRDLLPKLGFNSIEFSWNPITFKDEKQAFENAAVMSSINIEPKAIVTYLRRNGINDVTVEDFKELDDVQVGNQTARNKVSPSRQPSDKMSVTSNLNQQGGSEAGSKKLQEQSMNMRGSASFSKYPYVF